MAKRGELAPLLVLAMKPGLTIVRVAFWHVCHLGESLSLGSNEKLTLLPWSLQVVGKWAVVIMCVPVELTRRVLLWWAECGLEVWDPSVHGWPGVAAVVP